MVPLDWSLVKEHGDVGHDAGVLEGGGGDQESHGEVSRMGGVAPAKLGVLLVQLAIPCLAPDFPPVAGRLQVPRIASSQRRAGDGAGAASRT